MGCWRSALGFVTGLVAPVLATPCAHAQSPAVPHALVVARDYDEAHPGAPGSVIVVQAPLSIVRRYEDEGHAPVPPGPAPWEATASSAMPSATPRDGAPAAPSRPGPGHLRPTAAPEPTRVPFTSTTPADPSVPIFLERVSPRILLVGFDGREITLTPNDATMQRFSVIADFDAPGPESIARVTADYDANGTVVRVETALPAIRVGPGDAAVPAPPGAVIGSPVPRASRPPALRSPRGSRPLLPGR